MYLMKMSQLFGFVAQMSGKRLHYYRIFIFVIEALSRLSGCQYNRVSLLNGIDRIS